MLFVADRQNSHPLIQRVPITAVAATGLEFLGLEASRGAERSVLRLACS